MPERAGHLPSKQGQNELQFSWENTLIDPTSLEMLPKAHAGEIDIANLTFPPRVRNLGLWNIKSEFSGKVPVEITYLTSGLSWRAFYMGTLTENEEKMRLQGYVRVTKQLRRRLRKRSDKTYRRPGSHARPDSRSCTKQYPYDRPGAVSRLQMYQVMA